MYRVETDFHGEETGRLSEQQGRRWPPLRPTITQMARFSHSSRFRSRSGGNEQVSSFILERETNCPCNCNQVLRPTSNNKRPISRTILNNASELQQR